MYATAALLKSAAFEALRHSASRLGLDARR
jgi:hypothetical protein